MNKLKGTECVLSIVITHFPQLTVAILNILLILLQ